MNLFIYDHANRPPEPTTKWIAYHRLVPEWNGELEDGQPVLEPILQQGKARLIDAAPGAFIAGTLVDCPEGEECVGCVVVDTGTEIIAVQSATLSCLMIEHAPCHLEFVAVPLHNLDGKTAWDWQAYEISPYGARILVSDAREEPPITPADQSLP